MHYLVWHYIVVSKLGYEYCFIPADEKLSNEMMVFVSDKTYEKGVNLFDAMLEVDSMHNEKDYKHITDKEFEHYMVVKYIGNTDKLATFIYFIYEEHLVSVLVFADVSENYLEYCSFKKIYFD